MDFLKCTSIKKWLYNSKLFKLRFLLLVFYYVCSRLRASLRFPPSYALNLYLWINGTMRINKSQWLTFLNFLSGEKPHVCMVCNKGFSTSSSLNTHRRIHSGEKPHQCQVCGKRFTASSNLYYHRMTHIKVRR